MPIRWICGALLLTGAVCAQAMTPEGREFLSVLKELEPVQCEKRKLRRAIALADAEKRSAEAKELRGRFAALNRDRRTSELEKRLAQLEPRILDGQGKVRDPEDLEAISQQQRLAFYRCE